MALLTLADGRRLEYTDTGPAAGGRTVVYHHGTPGTALVPAQLLEAAIQVGWRVVAANRPGYGASSPRSGRRVADQAADTAELLDGLGIGEFAAVGWSGGGPHALADAAGLPGRCVAVATLAGVAPSDAEGLDWLDGMGQDNLTEFALARQGPRALHDGLTMGAAELRHLDTAALVEAMGSLLPDADRAAIDAGAGDELAAILSLGVAAGVEGWADDDLAFVAPWGFDPAVIPAAGTRVGIWQGGQDLMVPAAHGRWLAETIPGAVLHATDHDGHLSLLGHAPEVMEFLGGGGERAGSPAPLRAAE